MSASMAAVRLLDPLKMNRNPSWGIGAGRPAGQALGPALPRFGHHAADLRKGGRLRLAGGGDNVVQRTELRGPWRLKSTTYEFCVAAT